MIFQWIGFGFAVVTAGAGAYLIIGALRFIH